MIHVREPLGARHCGLEPAFPPFGSRRRIDIRAVAERLQDNRLEVTVEDQSISDDCLNVVHREPQVHERSNGVARRKFRIIAAPPSVAVGYEKLEEWRIRFL